MKSRPPSRVAEKNEHGNNHKRGENFFNLCHEHIFNIDWVPLPIIRQRNCRKETRGEVKVEKSFFVHQIRQLKIEWLLTIVEEPWSEIFRDGEISPSKVDPIADFDLFKA